MNFSDKQSAIIKLIGESLHKKDVAGLKKGLLAYSDFAKANSEAFLNTSSYKEAAEWQITAKRFDAIVVLLNKEGLSENVRNAIATKGKSLDAPKKVSAPVVNNIVPQPGYTPNAGYTQPAVVLVPDPNWITPKFKQFRAAVATIETETGAGTGFFISNNGYMLTNHHVVHDGNIPSRNIHITTGDGKINCMASLIDADKKSDIALLHLNNFKNKTPFIPMIPDFSSVSPGDAVMVMGNALGIGLSPEPGTVKFPKSKNLDENLLYSASTNCGDSGSPLINSNGMVIGVNKASWERSDNTEVKDIAVATNGDKVKSLLAQWQKKHGIKFLFT